MTMSDITQARSGNRRVAAKGLPPLGRAPVDQCSLPVGEGRQPHPQFGAAVWERSHRRRPHVESAISLPDQAQVPREPAG